MAKHNFSINLAKIRGVQPYHLEKPQNPYRIWL